MSEKRLFPPFSEPAYLMSIPLISYCKVIAHQHKRKLPTEHAFWQNVGVSMLRWFSLFLKCKLKLGSCVVESPGPPRP